MTKLRHYDNLGTVRFVTFSTYHRKSILTKDTTRRIVIDHIDGIRRTYSLKLLGYVLMPDHVHVVIYPPDGLELGRIIGEMKSRSARAIFLGHPSSNPETKKAFWQKRCYDHNCRTPETAREKINYCHINPVRRGLVAEPGDWRWSSYNWYMGNRDVPIEMDEFEF